MRLGGLGLRSAERTAPAAFLASWADAIHMLQQRSPQVCARILQELSHESAVPCIAELQAAERLLRREGFLAAPGWQELANDARPPQRVLEREVGEWSQGWQFFASTAREIHFRQKFHHSAQIMALLRSRSGPGTAAVLGGGPARPEY